MVVKGCAIHGTAPFKAVTLGLDFFNKLEEENAILLRKEHVYDLTRGDSFLGREGEGGRRERSTAHVAVPFEIIALDLSILASFDVDQGRLWSNSFVRMDLVQLKYEQVTHYLID